MVTKQYIQPVFFVLLERGLGIVNPFLPYNDLINLKKQKNRALRFLRQKSENDINLRRMIRK